MKKREKNTFRHSQCDYSLAFKLQVVQQIEKGELSYKKRNGIRQLNSEGIRN